MSDYQTYPLPYPPAVKSADERKLRRFRRLLERWLAELRGELASMVECACELAWDGMDLGTAEPETIRAIADRVLLIREIEAEIGRPFDHPEPQWLDDLLDGKRELVEWNDPA